MPRDGSGDILFSRDGAAGRILLNRPKSLNAITHDMVVALQAQLSEWAIDGSVKLVIIEGAGDKAFCAGGDIRDIYDTRGDNDDFVKRFFTDEYRMNMFIKSYPKPYIAIMDGIVMGGGVGVSVAGSKRIVTERTRCAMPETGIGLFPDVGGTYYLSRSPGNAGVYLGLTGERMKAADAIHAGFADCNVASEKVTEMLAGLCAGEYNQDPYGDVDKIVKPFQIDPGPVSLDSVDDAFSLDSLEDIISALKALKSDWGNQTLATLNQKSPTALMVTLRAIQSARELSFNDSMAQEYRMVLQTMKGDDIYEGIRALLIDKDGQPQWRPETLDQVTDDRVDAHFQQLGDEELTGP